MNNALYYRDIQYIDEINKWSEIFDEVMPTSTETKYELADNIYHLLQGSMLNNESKESVISMVLEKINESYVNN